MNASIASRPLAASATTSSVGLLVDDVGDAGPQQRVIVDDEHARARRARRRRRGLRGSAVGMVGSRNRERRRLPRQHDLGAGPRRRDERQRRADALGALAHARHAEAGRLPRSPVIPRPSSATDRRKPTPRTAPARTTMRRARAWRTALVSASWAMPMISRSTPASNVGSSSIDELDRHVVGARREIDHALERGGDVLALARLRPERGDRSARLDQMRAREIDGGLETARRRRRTGSRRRARCAACSCIRMAPNPCASVSWMSRAMRLRSSSTACRRASSRL